MRGILRSQVVIVVLQNVGNVFAYLFQVILVRSLSPSDFGAFNTLFSIALILSSPQLVLQYVYSRQTLIVLLKNPDALYGLLLNALRTILAIALSIAVITMLMKRSVGMWLRVSELHLILVGCIVATTFAHSLIMGIVQGKRDYTVLGLGISAIPFSRFLLVIPMLLGAPWGVDGAIWACFLGSIVGLVYGVYSLKDDFFKTTRIYLPSLKEMWHGSAALLVTAALVMLLGNADMLAVRYYCSAEGSGFYATAALLGRIAFLLPAALANVLFPEAVHAEHKGQEGSKLLWLFLGTTAALAGSVALVCSVWPTELLQILMGKVPENGDLMLRYISLAMALLAVNNSLFTYCLARKEHIFLVPLFAGVVFFVLAVWRCHATPEIIAKILFLTLFFILLGSLILRMRSFSPALISLNWRKR